MCGGGCAAQLLTVSYDGSLRRLDPGAGGAFSLLRSDDSAGILPYAVSLTWYGLLIEVVAHRPPAHKALWARLTPHMECSNPRSHQSTGRLMMLPWESVGRQPTNCTAKYHIELLCVQWNLDNWKCFVARKAMFIEMYAYRHSFQWWITVSSSKIPFICRNIRLSYIHLPRFDCT